MENMSLISILCTGLLGFFVGMSELVNRYNSFAKVFKNIYSIIYMLINLIAAILVYAILKIYKINIGEIGKYEIGICIFSGLGAMAFLRSSFFNYRNSNGQVISVGPAAILSVFLRAAELDSDRIISNDKVKQVIPLMRGLNFISASKDLPLIVLSSMSALNSEEQKVLSDEILKLVNDTNPTQEAKNIALGALLVKYTGFDMLKTCSEALKGSYDAKMKPDLEKITNLQEKLKAFQQL